ncbi:MAG: hypothetical protein ACE14T_11190 [Syntrophales bacterium]
MKRPYERHPIFIHKNAVAVINIYTRHDCIEDIFTVAECYHDSDHVQQAQQFIDQMENHWTPAFLMALRDAITERLHQHDADYGTDFAKEKW